ncbi:MAG: glycosyl hydrolase family 28 protein, partial [Bacteroidales bacterium]
DGIDPDGCKDLRIANSTIETGDDAICFYSMNWFGPALPCENITVTNCRLSSASSAIKFCDGNMNAVRNVTITNCVIAGANRGIAFMNFDGGVVSDVVISNVVIDTVRHAYFWWGDGDPLHFNIKRRSEVHKSVKPGTDAPAGVIRRVLISNVIARGQGSSVINGHPDSWLEDITLDNVRLYLTSDPKAPYDKAVHALDISRVRNLTLRAVEVNWGQPSSATWQSALNVQEAANVTIDGFGGRQAGKAASAAIVLARVQGANVQNCRAPDGTGTFLRVSGRDTRDVSIGENDFSRAREAVAVTGEVAKDAVRRRR